MYIFVNYFIYFNFPQDKRKTLKSTNPLERINRELRRVTRRAGCFQSQQSLDVCIYLTLEGEGLIIDRGFEAMSEQNEKTASLEFANNS